MGCFEGADRPSDWSVWSVWQDINKLVGMEVMLCKIGQPVDGIKIFGLYQCQDFFIDMASEAIREKVTNGCGIDTKDSSVLRCGVDIIEKG